MKTGVGILIHCGRNITIAGSIPTYKVATCSVRQVCGGCTILMGKAGNILLYKTSFIFQCFIFVFFSLTSDIFFGLLFSALMVIHHRQHFPIHSSLSLSRYRLVFSFFFFFFFFFCCCCSRSTCLCAV